jgi:hypothetical protein
VYLYLKIRTFVMLGVGLHELHKCVCVCVCKRQKGVVTHDVGADGLWFVCVCVCVCV